MQTRKFLPKKYPKKTRYSHAFRMQEAIKTVIIVLLIFILFLLYNFFSYQSSLVKIEELEEANLKYEKNVKIYKENELEYERQIEVLEAKIRLLDN